MDHSISADATGLLGRLGLTANYLGYHYIVYGLYLTKQQPDRLLLVTKWLYPDIAKHYQTNWIRVERDIRMAIAIIWTRNPALLAQLAGYPMTHRPTAAQFIAILHAHFCAVHAA